MSDRFQVDHSKTPNGGGPMTAQAIGLSFTHILVRLNRHPLCKAGVNRGRSKSFAIQALHRICDP